MKKQTTTKIDFSKIEWDYVDETKAKFIYEDVISAHKEALEHMNVITSKAFNLFSLFLPLLIAIVGFLLFKIDSDTVSFELKAIAIFASVYIFILLLFLLFVLFPKGFRSIHGTVKSYFCDNFYTRDTRSMLIGIIVDIHDSDNKNYNVRKQRAKTCAFCFKLSALFPIISFVVYLALLHC